MKAKKLIEVALPIKEISAGSVRDKSIRHGHISTLHLWWARRPLPVCRAVVFAPPRTSASGNVTPESTSTSTKTGSNTSEDNGNKPKPESNEYNKVIISGTVASDNFNQLFTSFVQTLRNNNNQRKFYCRYNRFQSAYRKFVNGKKHQRVGVTAGT